MMAESTESSTTSPDECKLNLETLVQNGKNLSAIRCQRCPSLILSPGQATFVAKQIFLPHMKKKSEQQQPEEGEDVQWCWRVNDMFTFENVGFSNTIGTTKYLICADCEIGPIGLQDMNDKTSIYVALGRVRHE